MKGSGSQFGKTYSLATMPSLDRLPPDTTTQGIVTQFTIEAHPIGQVWGGARLYDPSKKDALFAALHNFVPANADDPKSAVIFTDLAITLNGTGDLVFYFHEGPDKPTSGPLKEFLDIPPLFDLTKTQSYAQLLKGNGDLSSLSVARTSFRVSLASSTTLFPSPSSCNLAMLWQPRSYLILRWFLERGADFFSSRPSPSPTSPPTQASTPKSRPSGATSRRPTSQSSTRPRSARPTSSRSPRWWAGRASRAAATP